MRDLGTFGGIESLACGVNDTGQIVGFFSTFKNQWRAFLHDPNLGMRDLGPTEFGPAATCHINNQGFVVGQFGSAQEDTCVSTWTVGTGPRQLPLDGRDWVQVSALDDANHFFVNTHRRGFRWRGRRFWDQTESYSWKSATDVRCLNDQLGRTDIEGLAVTDVNKDGKMVGSLSIKRLPYPHAVFLEPIK